MTSMTVPGRQIFRAFVLLLIGFALAGCSIFIREPADKTTLTLPSPSSKVHVVIYGNASYSGLQVTIDAIDVSNQMTYAGQNETRGDFLLAAGLHTITATADVACWWCTGNVTSPSSKTQTFIVAFQPQALFSVAIGGACSADKYCGSRNCVSGVCAGCQRENCPCSSGCLPTGYCAPVTCSMGYSCRNQAPGGSGCACEQGPTTKSLCYPP